MGLLLSSDHTATLTDPSTWKDNPFVTRDLRRDIKKRQPFLSFCWMCGVLLLVGAWTSSFLWSVHSATHSTPLFIGGDIGTGLCVVISGVHIWFISGAARKHTVRLFTEESNQNTLNSLLMLPVSPFQILVQAMAYPWIVAMRMALALLPVYVFCVGIDGPTWIELVMLYLVFAMTALSVPFWRQPALSENVSILAQPGMTRLGQVKQTEVGQRTAANNIGAAKSLLIVVFLVPVTLSYIAIQMSGGMTAFDAALRQYLPNSIISLLVAFPISWPLILARLFITPLDWFGFSIIPLPFILVLFLLSKYSQLVRASELLSIGAYRDLPLQSTYYSRIRLVAGLRIAQALVITGYLWKWAVVNGALVRLAPKVTGSEPGLAGFAILLLYFAAFWGFARGAMLGQWQNRPLIRGERFILCRNSLLDGARYLAEPFAFAALFYLACCLLARTDPFPPLINALDGNLGLLLLHGWVMGLAGAFLSFGVSRILGTFSSIPRIAIPCLIGLSVLFTQSLDVRQWLAGFPQAARALSFIPPVRRLEIFSPFLGMLHVTSSRGAVVQKWLPGAPSWGVWVITSLVMGAVLWLIGHLVSRYAEIPEAEAVTLVFNPTVLGREVFSDPVQLKQSSTGKADTPFVRAIISRLQRIWDNAVAIRELRSRLRGQWDRGTLLALFGAAIALTAVCFYPAIAPVPTAVGGWVAFALMGGMNNSLAATAAGVLGCWYLALFVSVIGNAFSTTGAFYAETQKSTLGFLLSTPMETRAIVLGKMFGILGPSLGILAAISGWTLLLTILFLPLVGPLALIGWMYAILTALTFYLMVNALTFAISALFPRLSMSGAVWVWILVFYFGIGPLAGIYGMLSITLFAMGLQGASLWFAFIVVGWLLIVVAYLIALSSISSMRRKDLSFAINKRNN